MKTVEIKVEQGILRGEETESKLIFKGVPYAKPPIGNLRFSSPQAPDRWLGVRDALEYSKICPQPKASNPFYRKEFYNYEQYPYPEMSEDCLYLNTKISIQFIVYKTKALIIKALVFLSKMMVIIMIPDTWDYRNNW